MRKFFMLVSLLASSAFANSTLKEIPSFDRDIANQETTVVTCENVVSLLVSYQNKRQIVDTQVISNINDSASIMLSWYSTLSTNEGSSVYIPYGTFAPIRRSGKTQEYNAQVYSERQNGLSAELMQIMSVLPTCVK